MTQAQKSDTDSNIKIISSFESISKYSSLQKPCLIFDHIRNIVKHTQSIRVLDKDINFLLQLLWKTFSNPASQLLIPFNDLKHEIYRKSLEEALADVKDVICDEYACQTLRIHYQQYKYEKGDLRVYLVKKEELFASMMNVFHTPDDAHDPPNSYNPLFGDFGESLINHRMLYIEY